MRPLDFLVTYSARSSCKMPKHTTYYWTLVNAETYVEVAHVMLIVSKRAQERTSCQSAEQSSLRPRLSLLHPTKQYQYSVVCSTCSHGQHRPHSTRSRCLRLELLLLPISQSWILPFKLLSLTSIVFCIVFCTLTQFLHQTAQVVRTLQWCAVASFCNLHHFYILRA